jgi:pyruvate/2-oxoacid:ferredoxin oxidoreductase beta subunit
MISIVAAHGVGYVASANIAFPLDFIAKLRKAKERPGFRYVHVLTPNPASWGFPSHQTIHIARMATECGLWPLVEIEEGVKRTTYRPTRRLPVVDYLRSQRRFANLKDEHIQAIQHRIDAAGGGAR